jgi:hypothetical protein
MMTRFGTLLFFVAWLAHPLLRAQGIDQRGTVLSGTQQPVEFATVVLLSAPDSSTVQATVAAADGTFLLRAIKPGTYVLRASFIGLLPQTQALIIAAGSTPAPVRLQLAAAPQQLGDVRITATRPRITQLPDRLIVDVANTPLAAGYTALEVLSKSPGVYVEPRSESISLNGKGTVIIVDGKRTYMSGADLATFLKGLSSQELQKIELITSPGAKYDAEGPGGVINIVTKRSLQDGTKGSVTLGLGGTTNSRQNAGFTLNHKTGPLALYAGYTLSGRQTSVSDQAQIDYLSTPNEQVVGTHLLASGTASRQLAHNAKAGLDWKLTPKTNLNLYLRGLRTDRTSLGNGTTQLLYPASPLDSTLATRTDRTYASTQYSGNLGLRQTLDSASTLTADLDYSWYQSGDDNFIYNSVFTEQGNVPSRNVQLRNHLPNTVRIAAGQLDYERTLRHGTLGLGGKHSLVSTTSDAQYEQLYRDAWQNDARRTNFFTYRENITAAYATYAGKFRQLDYRLGLRLEQTSSLGELRTTGAQTKRSYLGLFPSVLLSKTLGKDNLVSLAYSRRVQRPNYQDLNPFIYFQDLYTYSQGNPFLLPSYTQSLDMTYTVRGTYAFAAGYSRTTDIVSWVTQRESPTSFVTQSKIENLDSQQQWTFTATAPFSPWKWWTITNSLNAYYTNYLLRSVPNAPRSLQGASAVYGLTNDFRVKGGWAASLSGYFQSATPNGTTRFLGQYSVNVGAQKKFMQDRLALRFVYNDVLRTARAVAITEFANLRGRSTYRWDSNFFLVTMTYQLGNQKVKASAKNRAVSSDEEGRIK